MKKLKDILLEPNEFQKIMQSIDLKWQKKERIRNKRINTIKILMQKLNE